VIAERLLFRTYDLLWRLILYAPGLYLLNLVMWMSLMLLELVPGLIAKAFFDMLTGERTFRWGVWSIAAVLLAWTLIRLAVMLGGALTDIRHRFLMSMLLRRNMFERVLNRPGAQAIPGSPGEAISTLRDDPRVVENVLSWLIDQIDTAVYAIVVLVIMLGISVQMTLLIAMPLVLVIAVARMTSSRVKEYREQSRRATERVTGALGEILGAVQAVQIANAEPFVLAHLSDLSSSRRRYMVRDLLLTRVLGALYEHAGTLGMGLVLVLAARSMQDGRLTLGDFAMFVYYVGVLSEAITFFGNFLAHLKQSGVSFARMVALMQGAPAKDLVAHRPLDIAGDLPSVVVHRRTDADRLETLTVDALTALYPDREQDSAASAGIRGISFEMERGDLCVITGRVGSGKTTLLRALLGLLPRTKGQICWNGKPVQDLSTFFVPPRSAYTPQVPLLFSHPLRENILLGRPEDADVLKAAIHAAVLEQDISELEDGLDTVVGPRGVKLSGGQVQRAAAARMFIRDPELLVFDDLSSALDVETEQVLWDRLFGRKVVPTCLVVSHRRAVLRRADQIVVLVDGEVDATGSLEELLENCPEMQRLWAGDIQE
jgi:ATP-binding cassette subfamily B protein